MTTATIGSFSIQQHLQVLICAEHRTHPDLDYKNFLIESLKWRNIQIGLMNTHKFNNTFSFFHLVLILALAFSIVASAYLFSPSWAQKGQVSLTAILEDQGDPIRWQFLLQSAIEQLRTRHPDLDIAIKYTTYPYEKTEAEILKAIANQTPIDLITVDPIWLGKFVQKGILTDLTNHAENWGRQKDWYEMHWDGGVYNDRIYAIWAWTDIRGMWYWKDLLNEAGVAPDSLKTWDGYVASAKKLNAALEDKGIEGVHLVAAGHSPDMSFYPYLWMLGGEMLQWKTGHPTKGSYWFPAYNSTEGVRALEFIKKQVNAGIKPQKNHYWGKEFLDRKFAVMLEALQHHVHLNTTEQIQDFEKKVGFLPMFPVPNQGNASATLMGGWEMSIPKTSKNNDLAWELITIILDPKILAPYLAKHGNLPTQVPIGEGPYSSELSKSIPYYNELISMMQIGRVRPSISEYPEIADHIRQALDEVFYNTSEPKEALSKAASKSAKALGW
jgi:multiple sugar transport system substrate-binding protein